MFIDREKSNETELQKNFKGGLRDYFSSGSMTNVALQLIGNGLTMGVIHVLTGPDHLSALATLSANVGNCYAFAYGIRWGIGHSTGLVIVASVLIAISSGDAEEVDMNSTLDIALESCVGMFMIMLGCYGMYKALEKRKQKNNEVGLYVDGDILLPERSGRSNSNNAIDTRFTSMRTINMSSSEDGTSYDEDDEKSKEDLDGDAIRQGKIERNMSIEFLDRYAGGLNVCFVSPHDHDGKPHDNSKSKFVACGIGIVHGVAGPGGVLGVIPAVQLKQWQLSALYLGSFCLASTLIMGTFAALYGIFSERLASKTNLYFQLECFSAFLSVAVGITWLTLLSMGKLDDIFP